MVINSWYISRLACTELHTANNFFPGIFPWHLIRQSCGFCGDATEQITTKQDEGIDISSAAAQRSSNCNSPAKASATSSSVIRSDQDYSHINCCLTKTHSCVPPFPCAPLVPETALLLRNRTAPSTWLNLLSTCRLHFN